MYFLKAAALTLVLASFSLSGCSWFAPYQETLEQGNLIDTEQLEQLEVGMSSQQVVYLLGSPLLKKPDNKLEWNYVYQRTHGTKLLERKKLRLVFSRQGANSLVLQEIHR